MGGSNILIDLTVTVTIENLARSSFWLDEELICGKPKLSCLLFPHKVSKFGTTCP